MGCNNSKQQDVHQDRLRRQRDEKDQFTNIVQSPQVQRAININSDGNDGGNSNEELQQSDDETDMDQYGTSFTNKKTQEFDILHHIVAQTRNNFIDVSQSPTQLLDAVESADRSNVYTQHLSQMRMPNVLRSSLFALPCSALDGIPTTVDPASNLPTPAAAIIASLTLSSIYPADYDFMRECSSAIGHSMHMEIRHENNFVLSFDQL